MEGTGSLTGAVRAAVGLVLPVHCAGCGTPGSSWCRDCAVTARRPATVALGRGAKAPPVWSATVLDGPVRAAVTAHKDDGRDDVRPALARLLAVALARALAEDDAARRARARGLEVLVVPVPTARSARRRRGADPVGALAELAARTADPDLVVLRALHHTRQVADQSGLGRAARRANLEGALAVRPQAAGAVQGRICVLVDDVVTTGATLAEAARALRAAGSERVLAATAAATPQVG